MCCLAREWATEAKMSEQQSGSDWERKLLLEINKAENDGTVWWVNGWSSCRDKNLFVVRMLNEGWCGVMSRHSVQEMMEQEDSQGGRDVVLSVGRGSGESEWGAVYRYLEEVKMGVRTVRRSGSICFRRQYGTVGVMVVCNEEPNFNVIEKGCVRVVRSWRKGGE